MLERNQSRSNRLCNKTDAPRAVGMVIIGMLALIVSQGVTAHCNGKHTGDHPHCVGEEPTGDPKTFALSITNTQAEEVFGFLDDDEFSPSPVYTDGDDFVSAKQGANFVDLNTGQNSPKKKLRKIEVDLGSDTVFIDIDGGVYFQSGTMDAHVAVSRDQPDLLNDMARGTWTYTTLVVRGAAGSAGLIVSFNDPVTASICDASLGSNGDAVRVDRTKTVAVDGMNQWIVSPSGPTNACVFLVTGQP